MLTCGPVVLALGAWTKLYWSRQRPGIYGLVALGVVTANAGLAAGSFLRYRLKSSASWVPGWEDPQVLTMGLLFLLAPLGMILGLVAGACGAPKWLIGIVEIASLPLLVVGYLASLAV
jgi:hypothetical protein